MTVGLASGSSGNLGGTTTQTASGGVAEFPDLVSTESGNIALTASTTASGVSPGTSGSITVSPAPPARLVIRTQPSPTATAGTPFATATQSVVVYEEDQYGNLETGDSTTAVTVSLGNGAGLLEGRLTATVAGGVATFTDLEDDTAGTINLQFNAAGLTPASSNPITISPSPTIIGEQVLTERPKGKKKAVFEGFVLQYSAAMNPATAGAPANYVVGQATTRRVRKKKVTTLTPVAVAASYNPANNSVTLILSGKPKFAQGGEITVNYGPGGVTSQQGAPCPRATHSSPSGRRRRASRRVEELSPRSFTMREYTSGWYRDDRRDGAPSQHAVP